MSEKGTTMDETKSQDRETIPLQDLLEKTADFQGGETVKGGDPARGKADSSDSQVIKHTDKATPRLRES